MRRGELMDAMRAGHPIDAGALGDRGYHGISPGLPSWVERLLGWSYLAGPAGVAIPTPSFLSLERAGPLSHRVALPRR